MGVSREKKHKTICVVCGKEFMAERAGRKVCGIDCFKEYLSNVERKKYTHICVICGKEYESTKKEGKYCSQICRNKGNYEFKKPKTPKERKPRKKSLKKYRSGKSTYGVTVSEDFIKIHNKEMMKDYLSWKNRNTPVELLE